MKKHEVKITDTVLVEHKGIEYIFDANKILARNFIIGFPGGGDMPVLVFEGLDGYGLDPIAGVRLDD